MLRESAVPAGALEVLGGQPVQAGREQVAASRIRADVAAAREGLREVEQEHARLQEIAVRCDGRYALAAYDLGALRARARAEAANVG